MTALFMAGVSLGWKLNRPSVVTAQYSEDLLQGLREAGAAGNGVASARSVYRGDGTLDARPDGWWELLSPSPGEGRLPGLLPEQRTVVVFVHGYNTPLPAAIQHGNRLGASVRAAIPGALSFSTFCWRGDFGSEKFAAAEAAADASAGSLARYLTELRRELRRLHPRREDYALILLTHSLGARLALEALLKIPLSPEAPLLDHLLLVQAAVTLETVCDVEYHVARSIPAHVGGGIVDMGKTRTGARYAPAFGHARRSTAVLSSADSVLLLLFGVYQNGDGRTLRSLPVRTALGTTGPLVEQALRKRSLPFPPALERMDLSPGAGAYEVRDHSQLIHDPAMFAHLWKALATPGDRAR